MLIEYPPVREGEWTGGQWCEGVEEMPRSVVRGCGVVRVGRSLGQWCGRVWVGRRDV